MNDKGLCTALLLTGTIKKRERTDFGIMLILTENLNILAAELHTLIPDGHQQTPFDPPRETNYNMDA